MSFLDFLNPIASVVGGVLGAAGQSSANASNERIAREQMAFQAKMSGTAYQRAVKDLEAAGLNPALAYGGAGGGSASTPSGSSTRVESVTAPLAANLSVLAQTLASTQLTTAQAAKARADADYSKARTGVVAPLADAEIGFKSASAAQVEVLTDRAQKELDLLVDTFKDRKDLVRLARVHAMMENLVQYGTMSEKIRAAKLVNALTDANVSWTGSRAEILAAVQKVLAPYLDTAASGSARMKELFDLVQGLTQ